MKGDFFLKYCTNCGLKNTNNAKYCKRCGKKFSAIVATKYEENIVHKEGLKKEVIASLILDLNNVIEKKRQGKNNYSQNDVTDTINRSKNKYQKTDKTDNLSRIRKETKYSNTFLKVFGFSSAIVSLFIIPFFFGAISLIIGLIVASKEKKLGIVICTISILCTIFGSLGGFLVVN